MAQNSLPESKVPGWLAGAGRRWLYAAEAVAIGAALAYLFKYRDRFDQFTLVSTVAALVLGIAGTALAIYHLDYNRRVDQSLVATVGEQYLEIDGELFRAQRMLSALPMPEEEGRRFVRETLQNILVLLSGELRRASVFLKVGNDLVCWSSYNMPPESTEGRKYSLSPPVGTPKGVVVAAYQQKKRQRCRFKKGRRTGKWVPDHRDYRVFDPLRVKPPYRDFVAIPLMRGDEILGVLCLDSDKPDIFKPRDRAMHNELARIEERVSAAVVIGASSVLPASSERVEMARADC
jgi:GAF domain-containing protein